MKKFIVNDILGCTGNLFQKTRILNFMNPKSSVRRFSSAAAAMSL